MRNGTDPGHEPDPARPGDGRHRTLPVQRPPQRGGPLHGNGEAVPAPPRAAPPGSARPHSPRWYRWPLRFLLALAVLLLGPLGVLAFGQLDLETHWRDASLASSGQAPAARDEPVAVVQVYGARAYNWRGAFGIHTWIASKRAGADAYTVYQVIGWNLHRGYSAVSVSRMEAPDFVWFNARPAVLAERRGPEAEALLDAIDDAVRAYPYGHRYRVWPGPNSNTFTAFVARSVPALGLDLPPTAIGKDYLPDGGVLAPTPSGTGWQVSLLGLLGVSLAREEGLEFNLLGLAAGFDYNDLALRLPGLGRVPLLPRDRGKGDGGIKN